MRGARGWLFLWRACSSGEGVGGVAVMIGMLASAPRQYIFRVIMGEGSPLSFVPRRVRSPEITMPIELLVGEDAEDDEMEEMLPGDSIAGATIGTPPASSFGDADDPCIMPFLVSELSPVTSRDFLLLLLDL